MLDLFTEALNSPSGQLAEVLIMKLGSEDIGELPSGICTRLDRLVDCAGKSGLLARVRLAADVPLLFERAPDWTAARIVPLFDWSSTEATQAWSARKYSRYIGSPKLFSLFKRPFLEMFGRGETPSEDLRVFAEWLVSILIANRASNAGYSLSDIEARAALRRGGAVALSSVSFRLAVEMEGAPAGEKGDRWRAITGPVFRAIWPLDVELQTPNATFNLVRILRATGESFAEAADLIIPFIQPDDPRVQSTVFSIAQESEEFFRLSRARLLDVIAAVVGDPPPRSVYALGRALSHLSDIEPSLTEDRRFQRLQTYASSHG